MEPNKPESSESPSKEENIIVSQQQDQDEEVTPQTLERFNQICINATEVMNEYKNQSIALKEEIADMVSIYKKQTTTTDAVPVEKIISITNEYEQGMRQANREYNHLAQELKSQEKERDLIMFQIKDCFDKLQNMEIRIKEKKRREQQKKLQQQKDQKAITQATKSQHKSEEPKSQEISPSQIKTATETETKNQQKL